MGAGRRESSVQRRRLLCFLLFMMGQAMRVPSYGMSGRLKDAVLRWNSLVCLAMHVPTLCQARCG